MQTSHTVRKMLLTVTAMLAISFFSQAQDAVPAATVPVNMTVTVNVIGEGKKMPDLDRRDIMVRQHKDRLQVTDWFPATGDHAGMQLFVLIDDASDSSLGSQLDDVRAFINAQPPSASIAIGYWEATVRVVQDFTTDHSLAVKAVRVPLANTGAYGSPYLSLIDALKRWPESLNRREVLMVTDGIDRARGGFRSQRLGPVPDVDTASDVAQRTGTIIYTIYSPGVGRLFRNYWVANNAQNALARLSEETGGESFYLGLQSPVSFKPYLEQVQKMLDNQYIVRFLAKPGHKSGLQEVKLTTEVPGVEFAAANSVWVPAAK